MSTTHEPKIGNTTGEKDAEMYSLFVDLFACPLCRHSPITINETYIDEGFFGVFIMSCEKCGGLSEYFVGGESIDNTKQELRKVRRMAVKSLISDTDPIARRK